MRKIAIVLLFFVSVFCNAQNNYYINEKTGELDKSATYSYRINPITGEEDLSGSGYVPRWSAFIDDFDYVQGYEPEALAYFAAMAVQWDDITKIYINRFIKSQKDSGLWAKKARVFLFASTSAGDCVIDLKGVENASLVNSPTFTPFRCVLGVNGKYINSNFNPITDGGTTYTLNNHSASIYINNNKTFGTACIGHSTTSTFIGGYGLFINVSNAATTGIYSPTYSAHASVAVTGLSGSIGLSTVQRTASNVSNFIKNGLVKNTRTDTSAEMPNNNIYILGLNANGTALTNGSLYESSYTEFGSGFTPQESLTNYNQIKTLLDYILTVTVTYTNIFDNRFEYSTSALADVAAPNIKRNAASVYSFTTNANQIFISAKSTITAFDGAFDSLQIDVNGIRTRQKIGVNQSFYLGNAGTNKTIKITEGVQTTSGTANVQGVFIDSIKIDNRFTFAKHSLTQSTKYAIMGNSITVGASSSPVLSNGFAYRFRDSVYTSIYGYGYAGMFNFASTQAKIDTTLNHLKKLLNGTNNKLVICLGTNDYGLALADTATFHAYYRHFLVDLQSAGISNLKIVCVAPLSRSGELTNLDPFRKAIELSAQGLSNVIYVNAKTFLPVNTTYYNADLLHPNNAGHELYFQTLYPYVVPY